MIDQMREKIKAWQNELFLIVLILFMTMTLVGALHLYQIRKARGGEIEIQKGAFQITLSHEKDSNFVASKNGEYYYPKGCAGSGRIKDENKLFFARAEEASLAGYALAPSCK